MAQTTTDKVLTIVFYCLTLATIIAYFATPDRKVMLYLGCAAIGSRLITYVMRYLM